MNTGLVSVLLPMIIHPDPEPFPDPQGIIQFTNSQGISAGSIEWISTLTNPLGSKGGRPRTENPSESTVRRRLRTEFSELVKNIPEDGHLIKLEASYKLGNFQIDYQHPKTPSKSITVELKEEDLERQIFKIAQCKNEFNISNAALRKLLGKEVICNAIKGDAVFSFIKKIKASMKNAIPIKELQFSNMDKEQNFGRVINATIVDPIALLKYILNFPRYSNLDFNNINVKISGDGRQSSRKTNFTLITLSILVDNTTYMEMEDIYTIGLVDIGEERQILEALFNELNKPLLKLATEGLTLDSGEECKFKFHFCSDWKFAAIVLGNTAANGKYSCLWCSIMSSFRNVDNDALTNLDWKGKYKKKLVRDYLGRSFLFGKLCPCCDPEEDIKDGFGNPIKCDKNHGSQLESLLLFEIFGERIWLDTLHSILRIVDLVEEYIIKLCEVNDSLPLFLYFVNNIVKINWMPFSKEKENGETKIKFPPLSAKDKLKLIDALAEDNKSPHLNFLDSKKNNVILIAKKLHENFHFLKCSKKTHANCSHNLKEKDKYQKNWDELKIIFISLSINITPYFHALEIHSTDMITNSPFKTLQSFSSSSQELKNQVQTIIQFRGSNSRNVPLAVVQHEHCSLWFRSNEKNCPNPVSKKIRKLNLKLPLEWAFPNAD